MEKVRADSLIGPTTPLVEQQSSAFTTTSFSNRGIEDDTVVPARIDDPQTSVTWDPASFRWPLAFNLTLFVVALRLYAEKDDPPEEPAPQRASSHKPMAFLFSRNKVKAPLELVRSAKEMMPSPTAAAPPPEEDLIPLAQKLAQMKLILQGTQEIDANPEQQFQLINALVAEDFLLPLTQLIQFLPFEGRKDTQFIFNSAFRYKHPTASAQEPIALHHILQSRPQIIVALCHGYDSQNSSWTCGKILQEAMKYDAVAALILYDEKDSLDHPLDLSTVQTDKPSSGEGVFWNFFDWITKTRFEVCADAWVTFKEVLTKHKEMVATWLETNYDLFFPKYIQRFVMSENYVTKRQSIKLLGELLLDRANYNVMTKFVDSADHLKTCMLLLRDDRKMISYEAFHVFKVFVANPSKSVSVQRMLINNRARLMSFLPEFLAERTDDDQFNDEKAFLIRQIQTLPPQPVPLH